MRPPEEVSRQLRGAAQVEGWKEDVLDSYTGTRHLGSRTTTSRERPMREKELLSRITVNPEQCGGRPCIRGMRIRVIDVLELLAAGQTSEEILADYPYLEPDDIAASLLYAARHLDHPILAA